MQKSNSTVVSTLTIMVVLLTSCSNQKAATQDERVVSVNADSTSIEVLTISPVDSISSPAADTVAIEEEVVPPKQLQSGDYAVAKGILTRVEESEMGPSWLDVDVNGTNMVFEDGTGIDGYAKGKRSMIGQELVIKYLYLEFLNEADIHVNDTSVRSGWDGGVIVTAEDKSSPNLQKIEGVITWTSDEYGVSGDISPSKYGILKENGTKVDITGRVYEELFSELNGKQATVYYYGASEMIAVSINNSLKKKAAQTKLNFIREKFEIITSKMGSEEYTITEFNVEGSSATAKYKRAKDGDELRFMSLAYYSDHGSTKTSYFFWNNQLIFEFVENSSWVGNTDEVYEKRNYYYDLEHIQALEREITGTGGYDAVKKQLTNETQTDLPVGPSFDMDEIISFLDISEEQAKKYSYPFFPDDN